MNVVLTGFMGAGKTTTGRRLAKLLHLPFIDLDSQIEAQHGSIAEIFSRHGEAEFRRLESDAIASSVGQGTHVMAVGGGAVMSAQNRRLLRRHGFIVHLAISPAAAWRRVAHRRHRPLLGERPDFKRIRNLMEERAPSYADCDFTVRVDHRTPLGAARTIARWYEARMDATTSDMLRNGVMR